jgi:hypothetical protein
MESKLTSGTINVDGNVDAANAMGDLVMASGLRLREELVRDYMRDLCKQDLPILADCVGGQSAYDDGMSAIMTDAAHRAQMTLLMMATIQPLKAAEPESEILSPDRALVVGH